MRWQTSVRTELCDESGAVLVLLLETNTLSWKLSMEHTPHGGDTSRSSPEWYPSVVQGLDAHDARVVEAVAEGWKLFSGQPGTPGIPRV